MRDNSNLRQYGEEGVGWGWYDTIRMTVFVVTVSKLLVPLEVTLAA